MIMTTTIITTTMRTIMATTTTTIITTTAIPTLTSTTEAMNRLGDKIVLVTGAAGSIGRAMAEAVRPKAAAPSPAICRVTGADHASTSPRNSTGCA